MSLKHPIMRNLKLKNITIALSLFFLFPCFFNTMAQEGESSDQADRVDVNIIAIPPHLGEIRSFNAAGQGDLVFHIQDAHCNPFAQHKISEIINYLNSEYGVDIVNLEGGVGEYDLSIFHSISGEEIRREVADYFVKKGEITGAEFFAINNPGKVMLWGVENKDLYIANLKVYRRSLKYKDIIDRDLKQLIHIVDNLKIHIFSAELLSIDKAYTDFKDKKIQFKEYVKFMIDAASRHSVDIRRMGNLSLLALSLELEKEVDFGQANRERTEILAELKRCLSQKEMREVVSNTLAFRTKKISRKGYYQYLFEKAGEVRVDTGRFAALRAYLKYISAYEAVKRSKVMKEMREVEDAVKEKIFRQNAERILSALSQKLVLLKNLFNISLTNSDYNDYVSDKDSANVEHFIKFYDKESPRYKLTFKPDNEIYELDERRDDLSGFYEYSYKRDQAFLNNLLFSKEGDIQGKQRKAILVTGGFHTENLCRVMRENNVSFVSIMPSFTTPKEWKNPYFALLAGEVSDQRMSLEKVLMMNGGGIAIFSKLNQAAGDIFGQDGVEAFNVSVKIHERIFEEKVRARIVYGDDNDQVIMDAMGNELIFGEGDGRIIDIPLSSLLDGVAMAQDAAARNRAANEQEPSAEYIAEQENKAGNMYEKAKRIAPQVVDILRRNNPTYLMELSVGAEDRSSVVSLMRGMSRRFGKRGFNLQIGSCSVENWRIDFFGKPEKPGRLDRLLFNEKDADGLTFLDNVIANPATRLSVRVPIGEGEVSSKKIETLRSEIREYIGGREFADGERLSKRDLDGIMGAIKLVPVNVDGVKYMNSTIDVMLDYVTMECDRYTDDKVYGEQDIPGDLAKAYKELLSSSVDFLFKVDPETGRMTRVSIDDMSVVDILDNIFKNYIVMKIQKIDWNILKEWKKSNDAILRSV